MRMCMCNTTCTTISQVPPFYHLVSVEGESWSIGGREIVSLLSWLLKVRFIVIKSFLRFRVMWRENWMLRVWTTIIVDISHLQPVAIANYLLLFFVSIELLSQFTVGINLKERTQWPESANIAQYKLNPRPSLAARAQNSLAESVPSCACSFKLIPLLFKCFCIYIYNNNCVSS